MKKSILLLSMIALPAFGQGLLRSNVTFYWNYDPVQLTNTTFIVKGSTDVSAPLSNWTVRGTVYGTTNSATPTNITINMSPQSCYFVCQASNFWGLSDPSNVTSTPAPPRSDVSLGVR